MTSYPRERTGDELNHNRHRDEVSFQLGLGTEEDNTAKIEVKS